MRSMGTMRFRDYFDGIRKNPYASMSDDSQISAETWRAYWAHLRRELAKPRRRLAVKYRYRSLPPD